MSVLACDRKGCENVMCDRYSHPYGYICDDCFDEMELSNIEPSIFMATEKQQNWCTEHAIDYDEVFPLRE